MHTARSLLVATVAVAATLVLGACTDEASLAAPASGASASAGATAGASATASAGATAGAGATASAGAAASTGASATPDGRRGPIAVIGDSITGGHGLSAEQAWPSMLARQEHWQLTNLSCDGAGVVAVGDADECAAAYPGLVLRAVDLHPAVVVLQASSNDLGEGDATIVSATDELVARVHREMPSARVVGLSAIWNEHAPPAQLALISTAMQRAIRREGGTSVDIGEPLRGHADWMQSDDVHPTEQGQEAIAADVLRALQRDHVRM